MLMWKRETPEGPPTADDDDDDDDHDHGDNDFHDGDDDDDDVDVKAWDSFTPTSVTTRSTPFNRIALCNTIMSLWHTMYFYHIL